MDFEEFEKRYAFELPIWYYPRNLFGSIGLSAVMAAATNKEYKSTRVKWVTGLSSHSLVREVFLRRARG